MCVIFSNFRAIDLNAVINVILAGRGRFDIPVRWKCDRKSAMRRQPASEGYPFYFA